MTPLNHVGLWIDDLRGAVDWLEANGVRMAPGGIRAGAAGHDICFIHPRANDAFPIAGAGVLIELVQAPPEDRRRAGRRRRTSAMTIHAILKMGDPRLLRIAPPVERFGTPELRAPRRRHVRDHAMRSTAPASPRRRSASTCSS